MMERRTWNQLKRSILELLKEKDDVTSRDVALALGCDVHNVGMALYRLHKQRLVDRETRSLGIWRKPPYHYNINDRGRARLDYYEELK